MRPFDCPTDLLPGAAWALVVPDSAECVPPGPTNERAAVQITVDARSTSTLSSRTSHARSRSLNPAAIAYIAVGVAFDNSDDALSGIIFDQIGVFTVAHTSTSPRIGAR